MTENLREAFDDYMRAACRVLKAPRRNWCMEEASVPLDERMELRLRVDYLEKGPEFGRLVAEANRVFAENPDDIGQLFCGSAISNFFRRSGFYLDAFEGHSPDADYTFQRYCHAFRLKETELTYLAPIEFVRFAEQRMDFGTFTIRKFQEHELDRICQNRINRVFYSWAAIDSSQLQDYWILVLKESVPALEFGAEHLELWQPEVGVRYTSHPKPVEIALGVLALFDWQANVWPADVADDSLPDNRGRRWLRFNIPFVLTLDDNLLKSPQTTPSLAVLATEPYFDPHTGEERGEVPEVVTDLDNNQPDSFRRFIDRVSNLLAGLRTQENGWHFFDVALGYLTKAFFAEGLEQLLLHITALEALLGENGQAVTRRLKKRVASILGSDENQRNARNNEFEELWDLRCDLVHGRQPQTQPYVGHLRLAREIARSVALWFLHYLAHLKKLRPQNPPTREECLKLLDKTTGSPPLTDIGQLPSGFPHVPEWLA